MGSDVGAELVRTIRKISLANAHILKIEAGISELNASEIYKLKISVEEASRKGGDVLGDLVESLGRKVRAKREYLGSL